MPQQNLSSVSFSSDEAAKINAAILALKDTLLPKLKSLKSEEKKEMAIMGEKTTSFVQKALEHGNANPELVPKYLDMDEFGRDMKAVNELNSFYRPLLQITDMLSDTLALSGSDAYAAALVIYGSVKDAKGSNVAKAETIYSDLSSRFTRGKKKQQPEE